MDVSKFVNRKVHDGWIVKRLDIDDWHSHFNKKSGGDRLIMLIEREIMPKEEYYKIAARRILTDEEYARLRTKEQQRYYNHSSAMYGRRIK